MYQDEYDINAYHFVSKEDIGLCVLARTKETALDIVRIFNERFPDKNLYVPKRFKFVTKYVTDIPPYEVEQDEYEFARTETR